LIDDFDSGSGFSIATNGSDQRVCSQLDRNASRYEKIWRAVRRIPAGRVATYGQIAELAGLDGQARQVGYALHHLPAASDVPWHRVINARGEVSARTSGDSHELQRILLEAEGIPFDARHRIDLAAFRWKTRTPRRASSPSRRR
jgi:methylated-DNA-protein-cysteine methyltransferase-like protein